MGPQIRRSSAATPPDNSKLSDQPAQPASHTHSGSIGLWGRIRQEGAKGPLATTGAITGIVRLLLSATVAEVAYFRSDEIDVQTAPLPATINPSNLNLPPSATGQPPGPPSADGTVPWEVMIGQLTAPMFIIPKVLSSIPRPPETGDSSSLLSWRRLNRAIESGW
jgi:hypothetical protein